MGLVLILPQSFLPGLGMCSRASAAILWLRSERGIRGQEYCRATGADLIQFPDECQELNLQISYYVRKRNPYLFKPLEVELSVTCSEKYDLHVYFTVHIRTHREWRTLAVFYPFNKILKTIPFSASIMLVLQTFLKKKNLNLTRHLWNRWCGYPSVPAACRCREPLQTHVQVWQCPGVWSENKLRLLCNGWERCISFPVLVRQS